MRKLIAFLFLILTLDNSAQTAPSTFVIKKEKKIDSTESSSLYNRPAFFKDSIPAIDALFIRDFIKQNIKLPNWVKEGLLAGNVFTRFIIKENGELDNITASSAFWGCPECDKEAVRLFKKMPKWNPALINSKPVSTRLTYVIPFRKAE